MTERVDSNKIEGIVGVKRHPLNHFARAVFDEQTVYILHSDLCLELNSPDLECSYTLALDEGIEVDRWVQDEPVRVMVSYGRLVPYDSPDPPAEEEA